MTEASYGEDTVDGAGWRLHLGDSCEWLPRLDAASVDFSIHSPPFASLYTYSPSVRDIGNCATIEEFIDHYRFVVDQLLRLTKPGRLAAVHVAQVPTQKARDGYIGLVDFRGAVISAYIDAGWIFHGEITVQKNPQAQAIRTKAKALLFVQMEKDSTWSRPALADYVLLFRRPGDNAVPVTPVVNGEITRNDWIEWAQPAWFGIRESDTLNAAAGRDEEDERHICPLQLPLIDRAVRLWSNPGELVLSPCAGIGSEGYQSVLRGRRFVGVELKPSYFATACENLRRAEYEVALPSLFDEVVQA
ncbi:MAG: site-specific DNA-methyltransferase [Chloroflexi bacterium]|nr:site-specific DNA-methyltransferase [Chloroflexota bacterium]